MPQFLAIHLSLPKKSLVFFCLAKKSTHFLATKTMGFTWFHPPKKGHRFRSNGQLSPVSPEVLAKGEQRHLLDGDRLVLNLGQAWDPQDGMDWPMAWGMGKNLGRWDGKKPWPEGFLVRLEEVTGIIIPPSGPRTRAMAWKTFPDFSRGNISLDKRFIFSLPC